MNDSSTLLFGIKYLFPCYQEKTLFGLCDDSLDDVEQVDRNDRDQVDQSGHDWTKENGHGVLFIVMWIWNLGVGHV